jgi:sugar-specific transcriptional regulator TrmB
MDENIGKSVYAIIIFIVGVCFGRYFYAPRAADIDDRTIFAEYTARIDELEKRKSELEAANTELNDKLSAAAISISGAAALMDGRIDVIAGNNDEAYAAVQELRIVQKQIQNRLLDFAGADGGVGGETSN